MAAQRWYILKIRPGFVKVVARRLRQLDLEVFIPRRKAAHPQRGRRRHPSLSSDHIYCRFAPEDRQSITAIPGVLETLGRVPSPLNGEPAFS